MNSRTHLVHPNCCYDMSKYQAVTLEMPNSFESGDIKTPPHWVIQAYRPYRIPDLDKPEVFLRPAPEHEVYTASTKAVTYCPFCASMIHPPERVVFPQGEFPVVKDSKIKICRVTDGGYYCDTCSKRLNECPCLPPTARWKAAGARGWIDPEESLI